LTLKKSISTLIMSGFISHNAQGFAQVGN